VTKWFVMVGFDVISDLGWSEPFNCVENGEVHEWVSLPWVVLEWSQTALT
jgi:hypothetical protein